MSWISDTIAGVKRIIRLEADVVRLQKAVDKAEATLWDHEKRLMRIETMIDVSRDTPRLRPH